MWRTKDIRRTIVLCFLSRLSFVSSFNVDTVFPVVYVGLSPTSEFGSGSHFGYNLKHLTTKTADGRSEVGFLVSAPLSNSTYEDLQTIHQPGVVYRCTFGEDADCRPLLLGTQKINETSFFDENGASARSMHTDNFEDAWFGGTVETLDADQGKILVCGSRWKNEPWWYTDPPLMNGVCYLANHNSSQIFDETKEFNEKLIPLGYRKNQNNAQYTSYRYLYGQAGASAHFTGGENNELLLGAPGIHNWTGSVIRYTDCISNCKPTGTGSQQINKGTFFVYEPHLEPLSSKAIETGDFFGYTVNSGQFFRDRNISYISSAPKANSTGSVFIFNFQSSGLLNVHQRLNGATVGEYFGAAIAVVDFNLDGFDDLIVGSPFYRNFLSSRTFQDHGKVQVFMSNGIQLRSVGTVDGTRRNPGRFGTAIAVLGDINFDGFPDVAIGAPYENDNVGAVYVYHGSSKGLNPRIAQRIGGEQFQPLASLKGFGISISSGDADANGYNDMLVGSFLSSHAVFLRTSPVVRIGRQMTATPSLITEPNLGSSFEVEACVNFTTKNHPESLCVGVKLLFDIKYPRPRVVLQKPDGTVVERTYSYVEVIGKDENKCRPFKFVLNENRDLSNPITMRLETELYEWQNTDSAKPVCSPLQKKKSGSGGITVPSSGDQKTDGYCPTCPVADILSPNFKELKIPFASGCGADGTCQADLAVTATLQNVNIKDGLVIGENDTLSVTAYVWNTGEPAYVPRLYIQWDGDVTKHRLPDNCEDFDDTKVVKRNADRATSTTVSKIVCYLPGPIKKGDSVVSLTIELDMTKIRSGTKKLNLGFRVESASQETGGSFLDNTYIMAVPLVTEVDLTVQGFGEQHTFNRNQEKALPFQQKFFVYQERKSPIELLAVTIQVPVGLDHDSKTVSLVDLLGAQATIRDQVYQCQGQFESIKSDDLAENNFDSSEVNGDDDRRKRRSIDHDSFWDEDSPETKGAVEEITKVQPFDLLDYITTTERQSFFSNRVKKGLKSAPVSSAEAEETLDGAFSLDCLKDGINCQTITCEIGPLYSSDELVVSIRGSLKVEKLAILTSNRAVVSLVTNAKAILLLPNDAVEVPGIRPNEINIPIRFIDVTPDEVEAAATWVLVVAVIGGLLLLAVILFVLYKCGFFKRKRPPTYSAVVEGNQEDED